MTHVTRLAGLALALPLLAGCGAAAETTSSDPVAVEAPAAQAVSREADGDALVARLRTALEGITTTRFDVRVTGDLEARATGAADLTTRPPTVRLTPETPLFGVAEVRLVKGVAYARLDHGWVRSDLDTMLSMLPFDLRDLRLGRLERVLAESLSEVEVSGDTGEEVWHATVDPARLLTGLGGAVRSETPTAAEITATFEGDRLDAFVVDLADLGAVEISLSGQGEPVRITAPRRADEFGWTALSPDGTGG